MNAENGIPLKIARALISRVMKKYPNALLRVTKTGIWTVRHTRTQRGFSSIYLDELLTQKERRDIEKARETEVENLIVESDE
jgi:hypothetical protein